MRTSRRFGAFVLLLCGCASVEEPGCQYRGSDGVGNACNDEEPQLLVDDVAEGTVARIAGPNVPVDGPFEVTVDRPDLARVLDTGVYGHKCDPASVRISAIGRGRARLHYRFADGQSRIRDVAIEPPKSLRLASFLGAALATQPARGAGTVPKEPENVMNVVVGGKAYWLVTYESAAGRPLLGSGATTYTFPDGVASTFVDNERQREIVATVATSTSDGVAELRAGDARLTIPFVARPPSAIDRIWLHGQTEGRSPASADGAVKPSVWVLARATDSAGRSLHGVPFDLSLDGVALPPGGELVAYAGDPAARSKVLTATVAGSTTNASLEIHAQADPRFLREHGESFFGCEISPLSTVGASRGALALGMLGLVFIARRKKEHAGGRAS